ncbi:MAG TPA: hypothetical protein VMG36_00920 [Thermoplasmata archaeon]|nr:hypothetical protein [Thermoplasmata archaeon]
MATRRFAWIVAVGCLALIAAAAVPTLASAEMPFFHGGPVAHHGGRGRILPGPYNLTFNETGLPTGTFWSVGLCGSSTPNGTSPVPQVAPDWARCLHNGTTNRSITYALANGSYHYQISPVQVGNATYGADPSTGAVGINGSGHAVDVTFAVLVPYNVSFVESGLPSGTFWSVQLGGGWSRTPGNASNTSEIGFALTNGTYSFSVGCAANNSTVYLPTPASGTVTVNGSAVSVAIAFAPLTYYNVSFVESGLPSGTFWSVSLVGNGSGPGPYAAPACGSYDWNGSTNASVNFTVLDGTYAFSVANASNLSTIYVPAPAAGNVTVNGTNVTVHVVFSPLMTYNVTFVESGLPNGTFWTVALAGNGGAAGRSPACGESFWNGSTNATVNFTVPDGNYSFFVGNVSNGTTEFVPTPPVGNVTVDGANVTIDVTFATVVEYTVTFNETGLPNGTLWWVVVASPSTGAEFNASHGNLTSFSLANGSYHFAIWSVDSNGSTPRSPSPASGTVTVSGANVVVRVVFGG